MRKVLAGAAVTVLGGIVLAAAPAHAAGPDLAITVTQANSPASAVATRVTVTVTNVGDAASSAFTVSEEVTGTGLQYALVGHPGWSCATLPLAGDCDHAAIAAGGSSSALSVDLTLTNGPVTIVAKVASAGDTNTANNSVTIVVNPRGMVVSGTVWSDDNGNGRKDSGEAALSDVKLKAFVAGTSTLITTEWTFGDIYRFILPAAAPNITIVVDQDNEQGRYPTTPNVGPDDVSDSDFAADRTITVPFTAGGILDFDAGLLPKGVTPSPSAPSSPSVSPSTSRSPDPGLPTTGVSLPSLLGMAALLIVSGVLLLLTRRRRSHVA